jgi:hypothetical protein
MKPQNYNERQIEIEGWPVNITSYMLGDLYYCKVDNVSPGAWLARTTAPTREEAEQKALDKATRLLGRTHRHAV